MKNIEDLKRLLPEMEKIADENERLLNYMQKFETKYKRMYEDENTQVSKILYEYFAKGVKDMHQYVQSIRHSIEEYKKML